MGDLAGGGGRLASPTPLPPARLVGGVAWARGLTASLPARLAAHIPTGTR
jgi:hypothetical protein